jgi:hypothetical protein
LSEVFVTFTDELQILWALRAQYHSFHGTGSSAGADRFRDPDPRPGASASGTRLPKMRRCIPGQYSVLRALRHRAFLKLPSPDPSLIPFDAQNAYNVVILRVEFSTFPPWRSNEDLPDLP